MVIAADALEQLSTANQAVGLMIGDRCASVKAFSSFQHLL